MVDQASSYGLPSESSEPIPLSAIEVFYAYSHRDESLRDELEKHLSILRRQRVITNWHDRRIGAGKEFGGQIDEHLNAAKIILLLISVDFLASDYCYDIEMERAIQRHEAGAARVIPVILRACSWTDTPFGKLLAVPKDGKPVTSWPNRDEAFDDVARGIREAALELKEGKPKSQPAGVATAGVQAEAQNISERVRSTRS